MGRSFHLKTVGLALAIIIVGLSGLARSDEYVIGPEDVLKISFWQDPTLDQVVAVRQDGKITLSIIGEVMAAGQTSRELADKIEKDVSFYNKVISQATVTVVQFNSQKIFVTGQVGAGGKLTFEVIPDLWTIIKEAGGASELGDLTRVTIIRSRESGGELITVNVLEAIANGSVESLPRLKSGDTVEIPKMPGGVPGKQLTTDYSEKKNLYYVQGQVLSPGKQIFEKNIDIFDAIGSAGGITPFADPSKVRIISKIGSGSTVMNIDLDKYQRDGQSRRILIKPEDTIIIDGKKQSPLSWGAVRDVAAVAGTLISFIYLIDRR
ncbi:MAG: hypothetical protein GY841_01585 [FCB group bacterium]|nr:hypothetical protein [FCB group bacterium]